MFLEFWRELLPSALFLFVYRHPLEVLLSLMRSGGPRGLGLEGLESWVIYNSAIMGFYERHRKSSLICHVHGITGRLDQFNELLKQKFSLGSNLCVSDLESLYHPEELRRVPLTSEIEGALRLVHPESTELYEQLNSMADLPFKPQQSLFRSSSDLSAFSDFVSRLSRPLDAACRRAVLLFLIAFLDCGLSERFFAQQIKYVEEVELGKAWLVGQAANWQQLAEERQAWIAEMERGKTWLEEQAANWHQVAEERQAWTAELEQGKTWLEGQVANWRQLAEARQAWTAELEQGKTWLEGQAANWQQLAEARQAQIGELVAQLANLQRLTEQQRQMIEQQNEQVAGLASELSFWKSAALRLGNSKWGRLGLRLGISKGPDINRSIPSRDGGR